MEYILVVGVSGTRRAVFRTGVTSVCSASTRLAKSTNLAVDVAQSQGESTGNHGGCRR